MTSVVPVCPDTAVVIGVAAKGIEHENRRAQKPRFYRSALLSPVKGGANTLWLQMVSGCTSSDFIYCMNIDRFVFFEKLLPLFKQERERNVTGTPLTGMVQKQREGQDMLVQ